MAELLKRAETENHKNSQNIDIPMEIQHREKRLSKIAEIQAEIKNRAQARYEQEKAEYDAKMVERMALEVARCVRRPTTKSPRTRPTG